MKYPKVLQVLAIATAISMAAPGALISTRASEAPETPQEYMERTGYVLPAGFHFVLDGEYVILDEDDMPRVEAEPVTPTEPEAPEEPVTPGESEEPEAPEEPVTPEEPEKPAAPEEPEAPAASEKPGTSTKPETPVESQKPVEPETPAASEKPGTSTEPEKPAESQKPAEPETPAASEKPETPTEPEKPIESQEPELPAEPEKPETSDNPEVLEVPETSEQESGDTDSNGDGSDADAEAEAESEAAEEELADEPGDGNPESNEVQDALLGEGAEPFFMTSSQFRALHERIQYNVEVPIEGLPSFITQEMIVGALKAQDETGYPASVTIAQIIQESGFGKYGPGGEEGKGLSYLAFEYCNLFGIKGTGTAGSVSMKTSEMESDGSTYSIHAGFRVYHTYTECIEDRSKILEEVYSDLTENVTDANTFAMRIGKRWATSINYGKHLINTMRRYDLYRLDDMKLSDFNEMVGEFANPCPGSTITSLFGRRSAPIAGASTYHKGLDMGTGAYNIPTYAAKAGTVIFAGEAGACGNLVTIDHGNGLVTKYMHHAEIYVEKGDKVEQGQQIGLSGTTGNSTGNHLHFQVEEDGRAVDPLKYLQASAEGSEAAKKAYAKKQAKAVKETKEAKLLVVKALMREKMNY